MEKLKEHNIRIINADNKSVAVLELHKTRTTIKKTGSKICRSLIRQRKNQYNSNLQDIINSSDIKKVYRRQVFSLRYTNLSEKEKRYLLKLHRKHLQKKYNLKRYDNETKENKDTELILSELINITEQVKIKRKTESTTEPPNPLGNK